MTQKLIEIADRSDLLGYLKVTGIQRNRACTRFLAYLNRKVYELCYTDENLGSQWPYGYIKTKSKRNLLASSFKYIASLVMDYFEELPDLDDEDIIMLITSEIEDRSYLPDIRKWHMLPDIYHRTVLTEILIEYFDVEP